MVGVFIILIIVLAIAGLTAFGYFRYRGVLRYAKGVERGLKMVPILIHLPPASDDTEVGTRDVRDVLMEKVSQAEVLYNIIASTAQKGFKSNFYGQRHFCFELVSVNGSIQFYIAVPIALLDVVKQAIISSYPTAQLQEVEEHNIFSSVGKISGTIGGEIVLKESYSYPIATIQQTRRDAMQSLVNSLSTLGEGDGAAVQIMLRPAAPGWERSSKSLVEKIKKDKANKGSGAAAGLREIISAPVKPPEAKEKSPEEKQLSNLEQSQVEAIEEKTKHPAYEVLIRVVSSSNTANKSQTILRNIVSVFSLFDLPGLNGFVYNEARDIENFITAFIFRFFPPEINSNILNSVELATLFHLPDQQFTHNSQLERQAAKQVDGPNVLPDTGLLLGYNLFRGVKKEIRLSEDDRRRHVYIVGQTGTGKSTLLENLILQDMVDGNGLAFVDPHGDTAEKLLSMVPKSRAEDVIYFNPGDMDNPSGLNLFEFETDYQKDFLIQEAINMLYKLYDPQHQGIIGPRYEHWFRNAALTLMADPNGATFIEIPKIFTDKQFVKEKLKYVKDPTVLDFWNKEMAQTSDYHKSEVLGWFVSKFGAFVSNEMMRNIIGQVKGSFDLRKIMDEKKILIVNLSKGKVGELNSKLLGMIFVMKFQAAAMSRANIPEDQRVDFSLYVDEFQNFSTDSFATILSEARKYHLNLIVANQFIGQLTEEIRDAVFGNVGTIVALRAGATDADFLVKQFSPIFDNQDIIKIPNYNAIVRLMVGGVPSQPFSLNTLPPFGQSNQQLGIALKQLSSVKYGRPRKQVETEIFKRIESKPLPKRPAFAAGKPGATGSARLPAGNAAKKPGSSSFLDDWLAKKRKETNTKPTNPTTAVNPIQTQQSSTANLNSQSPAHSSTPNSAASSKPQNTPQVNQQIPSSGSSISLNSQTPTITSPETPRTNLQPQSATSNPPNLKLQTQSPSQGNSANVVADTKPQPNANVSSLSRLPSKDNTTIQSHSVTAVDSEEQHLHKSAKHEIVSSGSDSDLADNTILKHTQLHLDPATNPVPVTTPKSDGDLPFSFPENFANSQPEATTSQPQAKITKDTKGGQDFAKEKNSITATPLRPSEQIKKPDVDNSTTKPAIDSELNELKGDVLYSSDIDGFSPNDNFDSELQKDVSKITIDKEGKIHSSDNNKVDQTN